MIQNVDDRVPGPTDDPIANLLIAGLATDVADAERLYLDTHIDQVVAFVQSGMPDEELRRHPLIALLLAHGSRGFEDSLR
jgi:hypothetical protein